MKECTCHWKHDVAGRRYNTHQPSVFEGGRGGESVGPLTTTTNNNTYNNTNTNNNTDTTTTNNANTNTTTFMHSSLP